MSATTSLLHAKISITRILATGYVALAVYVLSYILLYFYVAGDQVYYHNYYEAIIGKSYPEAIELGARHISAAEPLSLFVLWLGANLGFDKNAYISLLNVLLIHGLIKVCLQYQIKPTTILLIVLNFYVIVMLTGAERLKIAYLFLLWSVYFRGTFRYVFFSFSLLSHLQIFTLLPAIAVIYYYDDFISVTTRLKIKKTTLIQLSFLIPMLLAMAVFLWEPILSKGLEYMEDYGSFLELLNITLLIIITLVVLKNNRVRATLAILSFFPFVFLLGGMRVNMLAVTVAIYFFMIENRMSHPAVILLMLYFIAKSVEFIANIFIHGNGFA